jgi:hypothetical protein
MLEFPVLTCSWATDPPPLLEAIAGVVRVILFVKRNTIIAAAMKNTDLFRDIILRIHDLLIGFENPTSRFKIQKNYLIIRTVNKVVIIL